MSSEQILTELIDQIEATQQRVSAVQMAAKRTFYRRILPSPPAIAFSSNDGKALFRSSLEEGFMEGYFVLAEQFRTQDEPAFCGISTMTMVLNALAVDPKRIWKGPWRWYHESMLDCCRDLEEIKKSGIEFDQFSCLGRCNGLEVAAKRPTERHIYPTKATVEPIIEGQTDEVNGSNERKQREEEKSGAHSLSEKETEISKEVVAPSTAPNSKLSPIHRRPKDAVLSKKKESVLHEPNVSGCSHGPQDCRSQSQGMGKDFDSTKRHFFTLDEFREDVKISCASAHGPIVIVSYSRKGLLQTGDGHFSPIAGYNEAKDMCLIMDVARFKYPPHWVSTTVLYHAMCRLDPVCNQTRGWMVCSNAERSESYYFKLNTTSIERQQVETLKDALCCCSSRFVSELVGSAVHSDCDHDHGKMDAVQVIRCLLECLPTPLDQYLVSQTEKFGLTLDETHKVIKSKLMKGIRECGVHDVVCKLFEEESNADLRKRFEKCLKQKEVITLMVLVMGNDNVWAKLSDQRVAKQLKAWCAINKEKCPELDHEVKSLQYQIRNLNHFLASMYSEAYTAPTFCHH